MLAATTPVSFDMGPWIGVIASIITWTFFLVALAMLKAFITRGISIAVAELMVKSDSETAQKIARWFSREEDILEVVEEMREKVMPKKKTAATKSRRRTSTPDDTET